MSKRQALGVISNVNINPSGTSLAANKGQLSKTAALSSNALLKSSSSSINKNSTNNFLLNDENDPLQNLLKSIKQTTDSDFEIFQEELTESKVNFGLELIEETENDSVTRKEYIHEYYDEDECEDDDEDDDEDDNDEEDEDEENVQEDDQELEEEEEGISRLNLAAISEQQTQSSKKSTNDFQTSHDSPMALDASESVDDSQLSESFVQDHEDLDEESLKKKQAEERENLLMNCDEYREDILLYMRKMELENRPKPNYMKKQQDISSSMRSILVDWLVEVTEEYKLNMETLYLAVNYTDRFLSQMSVLRGKLQLVGTASMYIASKYEEITPPDISEFVYITDDTYTRKQVLRMEHLLLRNLDFKMTTPTTNWFLLYYLRFINKTHSRCNKKFECLARYLAELSLIDGDTFLNYLPSQIAASAVYLALVSLGKQWTKSIADTLGYKYDLSELKSCINHLYKAMQKAPNHPQQAIQEKYKNAKYESVALIEPPKSLPLLN